MKIMIAGQQTQINKETILHKSKQDYNENASNIKGQKGTIAGKFNQI
jgi:hypothetical protein